MVRLQTSRATVKLMRALGWVRQARMGSRDVHYVVDTSPTAVGRGYGGMNPIAEEHSPVR